MILDPEGRETVLTEGVQTHHLTVTERGEVYYADAPNHTIGLVDQSGNRRPVNTTLDWPHCLLLSPGQSRLFVTDSHSRWVWRFDVRRDGSLGKARRFCRLALRDGENEADPGGMAIDGEGSLYVATRLGVQVFDRAGRAKEVMATPGPEGVSNVFFAGAQREWLYVTEWNKMYRMAAKRRGTPQ